jgi:DNA adenine methylase
VSCTFGPRRVRTCLTTIPDDAAANPRPARVPEIQDRHRSAEGKRGASEKKLARARRKPSSILTPVGTLIENLRVTAATLPEDSSPAHAKPFLKWVGGKRQLLPEISRYAPKSFGSYHEPFVGGGAVFFHLRRTRPACPAFLTDSNRRLVRTYLAVQNNVEGVIALLRWHQRKHSKSYFHGMRDERDIDTASDAEVAAWLIYLNRTAFNGLYRVNSSNVFNVPLGKYVNPTICDEDNLRACARALAGAEIHHAGFESVRERAQPGDFVYFDPPYQPLTRTAKFTDYTREGFGDEDQERLRDVALELKTRGVFVVLSNSNAPFIKKLYRDGFSQYKVGARRAVNSDATKRGLVQELILK